MSDSRSFVIGPRSSLAAGWAINPGFSRLPGVLLWFLKHVSLATEPSGSWNGFVLPAPGSSCGNTPAHERSGGSENVPHSKSIRLPLGIAPKTETL